MTPEEQALQSASSEEERTLTKTVFLGFAMEDFINSPIGRYLIERAEHERKQALDALATVRPDDERRIRDLQQEIRVCDSWQGWIADAVTEGQQARIQLDQAR